MALIGMVSNRKIIEGWFTPSFLPKDKEGPILFKTNDGKIHAGYYVCKTEENRGHYPHVDLPCWIGSFIYNGVAIYEEITRKVICWQTIERA